MHPRLSELVEFLDRQRSAVLAAAEALPRERWAERPAPGRWSVADVAEHLYRVERGIARLVAKRVAEARAVGHPLESETSSVLGALEGRNVDDRSSRREAPEQVSPVETPTPDVAIRQLEESRAALSSAIEAADGLALGSIRHTHPALGEVDLYQWILFVGLHEARHVPQIHEVATELTAAR
jgi:uncharacterized damage-inducible protein DinB